jgi:hypothetical protein
MSITAQMMAHEGAKRSEHRRRFGKWPEIVIFMFCILIGALCIIT